MPKPAVQPPSTARGQTVACTLLPYDPQFELSTTLEGALAPVTLNHPHCAKFCVLGGGNCQSAFATMRLVRIEDLETTRASGEAGLSKLQLKGKGSNLPMPTPVSGTRFFAQTTAVIAQLREANGDCYETSFTDADTRKNDGTQYEAKK